MKKFLVALLSLALVISCVCLVACDKSQEILDGFSLPQDGATVDKDFTLPLQIGDKDVEWTSDDAAIALTKGEANWAAKVTPGDTSKVVTLTVKLGEVEKSFYVNVPVSDAAVLRGYVLSIADTVVSDNFTLPLQVGGRNVTWASDNAAVALTKGTEAWNAVITRGDEQQVVNLTVTLGESTKSFVVAIAKAELSDAAVLAGYTLPIADTVLSDNFTLPLQIGGREVTWTSDSAAVVLTKGTDAWNAAITRGETQQVVNLTVALGESTKSFSIAVARVELTEDEINAAIIAGYTLSIADTVLNDNFTLPLQIGGRDVTWTSDSTAVVLTKGAEAWNAAIAQSKEQQLVALTVALGKSTKSFNIAVSKLVLDDYILPQDGSYVEKDFTLPITIMDSEVEWISSDESAVALTKREENGNWLASVTLGSVVKNVTLTVKHGAETKEFAVSVAALDASYFGTKFVFIKDKQTVVDDFALAQETTIAGKTATISWAVADEESADFIAISEDGKTCVVTPSSLNPTVRITATFTYGEQTYEVTYRMTVSFVRTHLEEVDYWYTNTGVSVDMSGYIVEIATLYSKEYGNISLYMVDDDFCTGYYVYRLKVADQATAEALKPGVHITVTGMTNQNYNGLIETNAGGSVKIDTDIAPIDVSEHVYALDQDLLGNVPAAIYHESTLVSLSNWTVKSVKDKDPDNANTGTLFTLTKGGVDIDIVVSKYAEGAYFGAEQWTAACAARSAVKVGDVVSVTGLLGCYNKYQIILLSADGVTTGGTADADGTVYAGQTAAKAVKAVDAILKPVCSAIVIADREIEVPATSNGVAISYEILGKSNAVKVEDGKIKITPNKEENASLQVTYEVKDGETVVYSTVVFYTIKSNKLSDDKVAEAAKNELTCIEDLIVDDGSYALTTSIANYPTASISWAVKEESPAAKVVAGKLVVELQPTKLDVVLVATVTCGEASTTKEFTVHLDEGVSQEYLPVVADAIAAGTYKYTLYQKNLGKWLYATGEIASGRLSTTDKGAKAADVVVAAVEGGYTLSIGGKYLELDKDHKCVLLDAATGKWVYDTDAKTLTWTIGEGSAAKVYYLGTYNNFDTISASETKYITGDNASKVGDSQFVATFASLVEAEWKPEAADAIAAGTYKYALYQANLGKWLYATGEIASGRLSTTDKYAKAVDVTVAAVEGGYTLSIGGKYLELDKDHKCVLLDAATGKWVYDTDAKTLTWTIGEGSAAKVYYLGTYNNFDTISASETKYITGTNAANVGKTQFPANITTAALAEVSFFPVDAIAAGTYKYALYQANLGKWLYATGEIASGRLSTTDKYAKAVDVTVAAVEGGYTLSIGGKYLELDKDHKCVLLDAATGKWVYNAEAKVLTWTIGEGTEAKVYYLGTYNSFDTISASETKYITGTNAANVGKTQFPASLGLRDFVAATQLTAKEVVDSIVVATKATDDIILSSKATWAIKDETTAAKIENGVLVITRGEEDATVVIVATVTIGEDVATKEFSVVVKAVEKERAATVDCTKEFATITKEGTYTNYQKQEATGAIQKTLVSGDVKVINDIATGTNAVTIEYDTRDKELRVYAGTTLKIEYTGMTSIVITTKSDKKFTGNETLSVEGATIVVDGTVATITFTAPVDSVVITLTAQVKITEIAIYNS